MRLGVVCNANAESNEALAVRRVRSTYMLTGTANVREFTTEVDDQFVEIIQASRALGGRPIAQAQLDPGTTATAYAKLCASIADEFGQIAIEFGSEPGGTVRPIPPRDYARIIKEASIAIRKVERGRCLLIASVDGGYDWTKVPDPRETGQFTGRWVAEMLAGADDIADHFDVSACHPYPHTDWPDRDIYPPGYERPRGLFRQPWWPQPQRGFPDKQVAITEWGLPTAGVYGNVEPARTLEEQATALRTVHARLKALGWIWGIFVWMAHDRATGSPDTRDNMGLTSTAGVQKPAALVMRELARAS